MAHGREEPLLLFFSLYRAHTRVSVRWRLREGRLFWFVVSGKDPSVEAQRDAVGATLFWERMLCPFCGTFFVFLSTPPL